MTSGRKGSPYEPQADTAIRLARWKRLASTGMPVNDIARTIGISRSALDQMVCRARKRGHPDAILHPHAAIPGTGTGHLTDATRRAQRTARRTQETP